MHILETLISPAHALCYLTVKKQSVIHIQAWPSWLCSGYKSHIAVFNQLFYADQANLPNCHRCNLCHKPVRTSIWAHALVECTQLHKVDSDPMWLAFVSLISLGYQGLALYTCFPLFCKYHDQLRLLILGWRPVTHLVFWHIGGFKFIYIVNLRNMEDPMIFVLVHSATNNLWSMRLHRYSELVFCNYAGMMEMYVPAAYVFCFVLSFLWFPPSMPELRFLDLICVWYFLSVFSMPLLNRLVAR